MKTIFTCLAGFTLLALTTLSCRKEGHDEKRQFVDSPQTVTATVPAGQTYTMTMATESVATISRQASHYERSEILRSLDGSTVYQYVAAKGYTGADEVTLQQSITSATPGGGCSGSYGSAQATTTYKTIVIKFDVAN